MNQKEQKIQCPYKKVKYRCKYGALCIEGEEERKRRIQ